MKLSDAEIEDTDKHSQLKSTIRSVTAKYRSNKQCSIITYSSSQPILFDSVNNWLVFSIYNAYYIYIVDI